MADLTLDRPVYETAADASEERRIMAVLCGAWKCEAKKLPKSYNVDYALIRDKSVVAWVEIKRRFRNLNDFGCVFLSLQKILTASHLMSVTRKRCFFVIQFNDCLAFADMVDLSRDIDFRGRTDRGDWQDQEPVMRIPTSEFKVICT